MSNKPYDRTIIHPLEKPLADDINQLETNFDQTLRFFQEALFSDQDTGAALDGFMGAGLLVSAASLPDLTVTIKSGLGFQLQTGTEVAIESIIGLNDLISYKPIPLFVNQSFVVPTPPAAPGTRVDIIEVKADRITTDPSLRQVFDTGLGQFTPDTVKKTLAWALDGRASTVNAPSTSTSPLSYVVGQVGSPGVAPPASPGYIKIAEIAVGSDVLSISPSDITDFRQSLTERTFNLSMVPSDGFDLGVGPITLGTGGEVLHGINGLWSANIQGLENGDIVESIYVVMNKTDAVASDMSVVLIRNEVDVDALTFSKVTVPTALAQPPSQTALGLYLIDYAALQPLEFPFTWKKGWSASLLIGSNQTTATTLSIYFRVRRPLVKRDT